MSDAIRVEGIGRLTRQLKELDIALVKEVKAINMAAAEAVAVEARARAPKRSGRLAGSIRPGATQNSGVVRVGSSSIPYAGPIHFGWKARNIKPQPFLYEALDGRRAEVCATYERSITALVERAFPASGAD